MRRAAAQDLLDRIVTTARPAEAPVAVPSRRRRHPARWAVAGAAAVAVTATALLLPGVGGEAAYASWTATPAALPAADTEALSRDCLRTIEPERGYTRADLDRSHLILGERRGAYQYISMATPRWTVTCFRDKAGAVHWGSSFEAPVSEAKLGGEGVEMQGWGQLRTGEGYARLMSGHLGADVVGVDIATADGRTVRATVRDRYFIAWYPEADGTRPTTLTLRLKDGGIVKDLSARDLHDAPKLD